MGLLSMIRLLGRRLVVLVVVVQVVRYQPPLDRMMDRLESIRLLVRRSVVVVVQVVTVVVVTVVTVDGRPWRIKRAL
jgi:hypothetical protein